MDRSPIGRSPIAPGIRQYQPSNRFDVFIRRYDKWTHMAPDTDVRPGVDPGGADTVVGSIDATAAEETYVIADISADGAWLSMPAEEAPTLMQWR